MGDFSLEVFRTNPTSTESTQKRVDHVPYLLIFLHVRDIKREE